MLKFLVNIRVPSSLGTKNTVPRKMCLKFCAQKLTDRFGFHSWLDGGIFCTI